MERAGQDGTEIPLLIFIYILVNIILKMPLRTRPPSCGACRAPATWRPCTCCRGTSSLWRWSAGARRTASCSRAGGLRVEEALDGEQGSCSHLRTGEARSVGRKAQGQRRSGGVHDAWVFRRQAAGNSPPADGVGGGSIQLVGPGEQGVRSCNTAGKPPRSLSACCIKCRQVNWCRCAMHTV